MLLCSDQGGKLIRKNLFFRFLRATGKCFACLSIGARPSVRPCLSHPSHIKTVQARNTKSSLWDAKRLRFCDKISCSCVRGSPRTTASKRGISLKCSYFTAIASSSAKRLQRGTDNRDAYRNKHWWRAFYRYQHRRPWTTLSPKNKGLYWIFRISV